MVLDQILASGRDVHRSLSLNVFAKIIVAYSFYLPHDSSVRLKGMLLDCTLYITSEQDGKQSQLR